MIPPRSVLVTWRALAAADLLCTEFDRRIEELETVSAAVRDTCRRLDGEGWQGVAYDAMLTHVDAAHRHYQELCERAGQLRDAGAGALSDLHYTALALLDYVADAEADGCRVADDWSVTGGATAPEWAEVVTEAVAAVERADERGRTAVLAAADELSHLAWVFDLDTAPPDVPGLGGSRDAAEGPTDVGQAPGSDAPTGPPEPGESDAEDPAPGPDASPPDAGAAAEQPAGGAVPADAAERWPGAAAGAYPPDAGTPAEPPDDATVPADVTATGRPSTGDGPGTSSAGVGASGPAAGPAPGPVAHGGDPAETTERESRTHAAGSAVPGVEGPIGTARTQSAAVAHPAAGTPDQQAENNAAATVFTPALQGAADPPPADITVDQLVAIMPDLSPEQAREYLPALNAAMREGDITTPPRQAAFLAQLAHESCQLRYFEELGDDDYFSQYDPGQPNTAAGNTEPGDGPRYHGRGPIQLTGRGNYRAAGEALGLDLEGNPEMAARSDIGFRIAQWYWTSRNINAFADAGDFAAVTQAVNGGFNGLAAREEYYSRALEVLG
ncbi:glycoside hydrolase family 19 protein [Nocardia sp. BMG51109]|uniref:glycoside hydrolase family 19 protein n=1 Tax=Nocardia sp. BMG51109 TaxID=1056816 RepID=UPI0004B3AA7C|nr:glycoside hydrolase family 19 protein [Nocardia sp. BMG51109]